MRIMISAPRARLLVALLLCAISVPVFAAATDSFTATYKAKYGIIGLGTLKFQLKPDPDAPGCYIYTGEGAPNAVVSMLVGDLSDASHFCITDDGTLQPQYFRHHEKGSPKHSYTLQFDWQEQSVRYENGQGKSRTLELPETATDPMSLQIAARMWVDSAPNPAQLTRRNFTLVDEDEIKTYTLAVRSGGTVKVPAGRFDTLIVERVDKEDKRLAFWLAKYMDWIPVRVEHEQDGRTITMELSSIQRN